jgi:hypothetical protein
MPSERFFKAFAVTKAAQGNQKTKFDSKKVYKGTHERAARKIFTDTCKRNNKNIRGTCALHVIVIEVEKHMDNGKYKVHPKYDANGKTIKRKYRLRLKRYGPKSSNGVVVNFNGTDVQFKYETEIVNSFGRVR